MADTEHVEIARAGAPSIARWAQENPGAGLDLSRADLASASLSGADLSRADLSWAKLRGADLSDARLCEANMNGADLHEADLVGANLEAVNLLGATLSHADLSGADLHGANLERADLSGAFLNRAELREANLHGADLRAADLREADIGGANVTGVVYVLREMHHKYRGIRGVDSCYGDALFRRDAADQDYLDTFEMRLRETPQDSRERWWRNVERVRFRIWAWFDYGRSLGRVAAFASAVAAAFGAVYAIWPGLLSFSGGNGPVSRFTPFYYSIVTYSTLGFGDVTPRNWVGEVLVTVEVVIGYITLGLLLAILGQNIARRS